MNKKKNFIFRDKITKKIFTYTCSLLLFNFLLVSIIGNTFLEDYYLKNKEKYILNTYQKIYNTEYSSNEFLNDMNSIQYENIYITCYDFENNSIFYANTNKYNDVIDNDDITTLIKSLNNIDYIIAYPTSEYEESLYNITGRQQQITLFGKYLSPSSNKYIIIQTPYQPIISTSDMVSRFNLISSLIVLLASILPTLGFTFLITKPIKEATIVTRAIRNKDFSQRCIIRTKDEISEMEECINEMADFIEIYTKELLSMNDRLTNDIIKRKKLEQTQKDFISNVSHEIKTPISIISGYSEAMKQGLASTKEEENEFCDIIIDECSRMTHIVIELLDLSKLENGSIKLDYSDFNINELCQLVVSKFKLKCDNINVPISIFSTGNYNVKADYNEIEKIIINYMQNAYKHVSTNGNITVNIKTEGEYIYVGINNDGMHISDVDIDEIWNKFYKIDKSHKRDENSTGLGLSIVKATMLLHKMPFGVKNTENGVEFFIKLQKAIRIN